MHRFSPWPPPDSGDKAKLLGFIPEYFQFIQRTRLPEG
jgi:hypothetical protein